MMETMESLAELVQRVPQRSWKIMVIDAESSGEVNHRTEQVYIAALESATLEFGADHLDVAEAATYLADLYLFLERYDEAETLYRKAVAIYRKRFGKEHMLYSMALRNLAEALYALGKETDAKILRSQARGIFG